jgi:hypothetical protein
VTSTQPSLKFLKSVIRWLDVGYPQGVPGPDQVALFALLRMTPLTSEQLEEVVHKITKHSDGEEPINREEIAKFITETTHHDPGPENIQRVAATLAAAGWPLAGTVVPGSEDEDE